MTGTPQTGGGISKRVELSGGGATEAALHFLALLEHTPQPLVTAPQALLADAQFHLPPPTKARGPA